MTTLPTLPSAAIAAALEADETGDLAGAFIDAGMTYRLDVADLPRNARERDELIAAAIPNRELGNTTGTVRVRVTYRVPGVGDAAAYDTTDELDVVGVSARVIGFGGAILVAFADELPVRCIPTSTIIAIEPVLPSSLGSTPGE